MKKTFTQLLDQRKSRISKFNKTLSLRVSADLLQSVHDRAQMENLPCGEIIRRALDAYLVSSSNMQDSSKISINQFES